MLVKFSPIVISSYGFIQKMKGDISDPLKIKINDWSKLTNVFVVGTLPLYKGGLNFRNPSPPFPPSPALKEKDLTHKKEDLVK